MKGTTFFNNLRYFVTDYIDDFNFHSKALREAADQADFDNLQHTLSGVETGQQTRHGLRKDDIDPLTGKKKLSTIDEAMQRTLDWLLLNDPAYAIVHNQVMDMLGSAERTAQHRLDKILAALEDERDILDELLTNTAKLPDGTKVFKDENGDVRTQEGDIVDDMLAASIVWRGDEPSYEEYTVQKNRVEELKGAVHELRGIGTELGDIRGKLTDNEHPPTSNRVQSLGRRIGELEDQAQKASMSINSANAPEIQDKSVSTTSIPIMPKK